MKPNLFIIGAPKCGTSALAHYLSEHPKVFFSNPKEPFYLSTDYPHLKEQHFLSNDSDYLKLFSHADQRIHSVVGEGSTNYLRSQTAVKNALEINPQAKFIVMLRNPISVSHAFHMEQIFARNEDVVSFEEAWLLQNVRKTGQKIPNACRAPEFLQYGEIALFAEQIERFFEVVPEAQRIILLQDDLQKDTLGTYKKTLKFLDLNYDGRTVFPRVNGSHSHRSEFIANLVLSPPKLLRAPMFFLRGVLRQTKPTYIEWIKSKLRKKSNRQELSVSFKEDLLTYFLSDIKRTEALIERDLTDWKKL